MDTGRELEEAMRELEAKLPQLRRLMADAVLPFGVAEEAEAWAKSLLQSLRLTDSLASQLRRVLLGEGTEVPAPLKEAPFTIIQLNPPPVMTEMEAELERVFGLPVEQVEQIMASDDPEAILHDIDPEGEEQGSAQSAISEQAEAAVREAELRWSERRQSRGRRRTPRKTPARLRRPANQRVSRKAGGRMDREKPLIELWKAMTLERVWEIYAPVIVRALSRVCPSDKAEAEAEDAIVVIFHETFGQLRSGLPNLRHEVALLEWLPNVLQDIAARRRFCRCESRLFWWHLCNARFELMLSVLAERMLAAPIEEQARLREAYSKIERLHQEWLAANLPPSPEDPPGGAPAGAWPIPPKPPIAPAIQRPVWEAQLLPRNP